MRRAGRRLPEPDPVALPLDGHLAGGQHRRDADRRLARQGAEGRCRRAGVPPRGRATRRRRWPWPARRCGCRRSRRWTSSSCRLAAASGADKKDQKSDHRRRGQAGRPASRACSTSCSARRSNTYASSQRLQEIGKNYQPKAPYPQTPLANRLKLAAQLIDADLGARIFYVSLDGFDTHADQAHGRTPTCWRRCPAR